MTSIEDLTLSPFHDQVHLAIPAVQPEVADPRLGRLGRNPHAPR